MRTLIFEDIVAHPQVPARTEIYWGVSIMAEPSTIATPAGILSVKKGAHIAKLALLGNYMATSFVTAADGHGGTLVTEAAQTANQLVPLTTPHTG